ncbi:MAG: heavy metal translocating P-type ATPase, partial [Proteobacteria bacterium]|nr:heavy metal translocating P-type ATPase [Pseudomonadota bacterium]
ALGQKIPLEGKTDRILRWFVPLVLLLAVTTGWACLIAGHSFETAIIRAVTVMVISCPCALGIAIPIARVAGISAAGNKGILVRDFSAFEKAQQTDTIVFDKTGTLTRGEWSLLDIIVMAPFDEKQILAPAAALEQKSDHYIAAAIAKRALQSAVLPAALTEIQCYQNGISGMFGADTIKIGSRSFIAQDETTSLTLSNVNVEDETLQSTVYMSYSSRLCAVFVFGDTLRPTAVDTINKLRDQGYNIALVSGDGEQTTRAVGTMLGIDSAYGGKLPQDKAFFVQDLQQKGNIVTMVGDGVNDAPALIQADLAIAVHSGSRLGKEAADITLMRGTPEQILDYLDLARQVNKKIQQNLLFSLSYNFISIPVAMSGLLTPIVAVCAMLLSSLSVTGNTLLLARKYKSTLIDRKQNGVGGKFGVGPR